MKNKNKFIKIIIIFSILTNVFTIINCKSQIITNEYIIGASTVCQGESDETYTWNGNCFNCGFSVDNHYLSAYQDDIGIHITWGTPGSASIECWTYDWFLGISDIEYFSVTIEDCYGEPCNDNLVEEALGNNVYIPTSPLSYNSSNYITLEGGFTIPSGYNVTFNAATEVSFKKDFTSVATSIFTAEIQPCVELDLAPPHINNNNNDNIQTINTDPNSNPQFLNDNVKANLKSVNNNNSIIIYPNPFTNTTTIEYHLFEQMPISITIYNTLEEKIQNLVNNETQSVGDYKVVFDGNGLDAGIYYYTIIEGNKSETGKMVLIKQ